MTTPTEPTLEQKWIEVLEWAGWTRHNMEETTDNWICKTCGAKYSRSFWEKWRAEWGYCQGELPPMSLDAVFEVEEKLPDWMHGDYEAFLLEECCPKAEPEVDDTFFPCIHSKAIKRINALWRTVKG